MLRGLGSNHKSAKEYFPLLKSLYHDPMLSTLSKQLLAEYGMSCTPIYSVSTAKSTAPTIRLETISGLECARWNQYANFSPQASRLLLELLQVAVTDAPVKSFAQTGIEDKAISASAIPKLTRTAACFFRIM